MFENILKFFKKLVKTEKNETSSKNTAKERLHLVLMQDRANVSADFLELMKQEIIEVIKKYIEVEEGAIDVRLTNEVKEDGTTGAPSLYANIPIVNIKNETKKEINEKKDAAQEEAPNKEEIKSNDKQDDQEQVKEDDQKEDKKEAEKVAKEDNDNSEIEEDKTKTVNEVESKEEAEKQEKKKSE